MDELELKFTAPEVFAPERLVGGDSGISTVEGLPSQDLRTTYYDSTELSLARHGITLRHRSGEGTGDRWTVKLPVPHDAATHTEVHFEGGEDDVPDTASNLLIPFVRSSPIGAVARTTTRRQRWALRSKSGTELAELADDHVSVVGDGSVIRTFRELEIEARAADRQQLEALGEAIERAGARRAPSIPKAVQVLGPRAAEPPDVVVPKAPSRSDPSAQAIRLALSSGLQRILLNDPPARLGDVEGVHQMRVGARRLRSDLRTFGPLVDGDWATPLRAELKWLGVVLGDVRDLDVMRDNLAATAGDLQALQPLYSWIDDRHREARDRLTEALTGTRYIQLLDGLVEGARNPRLTDAAQQPCDNALPPLVARSWKRLKNKVDSLGKDPSDEELHRVRILAKRARYSAEVVAPALGTKSRKKALAFAVSASQLQDQLGVLQDSVVLRARVLKALQEHPNVDAFSLDAGRVIERQEQVATEARASWAKAFGKLDRNSMLDWMR